MAKQDRPEIPDPVQREVRQRCGFGCVVCGLPFYHYDHMEDWSITQTHDPANVTLLCHKHHGEKTNGLLPLREVKKANDNPHNKRQGVSTPYDLHFTGRDCEIV